MFEAFKMTWQSCGFPDTSIGTSCHRFHICPPTLLTERCHLSIPSLLCCKLTLRFLLYACPPLAHFILETNAGYFDIMNAIRLTFRYWAIKISASAPNCSLGHWLGPGRFSWSSASTPAGGDPYIKIYIWFTECSLFFYFEFLKRPVRRKYSTDMFCNYFRK